MVRSFMDDSTNTRANPMQRSPALSPKIRSDSEDGQWTTIIRPRSDWFDVNLAELWQYRDLIRLFVRRDFVAQYKQTILGPLWFFIQPLLTTLVFTVVFGRIAKISTDGVPDFLFYLSGTVCWQYFSTSLVLNADTFVANAGVFGKVYFPRLAVPVSIVISGVFKFLIQFALFLIFLLYFFLKGSSVGLSIWAITLPLLLFQMGLLGIGCGILVSSLTTRYQDLRHVVAFGAQLWMYATPVVYPLSVVPERFRDFFALNPMMAVVEGFRSGFVGVSAINGRYVAISWAVTLVILFIGLMVFSRVEKTFMDTV
jgi:lipopolysaccharide transport system permease protein